jgi:nucleoside-diphosphate-sugar epimerase
MRVLFIGGTGNISTACTRLALEKGMELSLLNRGRSACLFSGHARIISCDIRDRRQAAALLQDHEFDVVVNWVAYLPEHIETDIALFRLITESTPLLNPFWQYARDKIACEERLSRACREEEFPVTVVRPALTYGDTWIPCAIGGHDYTIIDRMKKGKKIVVHGDGQSLWVMTHNSDFAKGLIGLLGNPAAIGEQYHITSDEVLNWDKIYRAIGNAAGLVPDLIHVPSDFINLCDQRIGAALLGDKAYSVVFDNSKIKQAVPEFRATVPFAEGMKRCIEWFEGEEGRKTVSETEIRAMDRIVQSYQNGLASISKGNPIL